MKRNLVMLALCAGLASSRAARGAETPKNVLEKNVLETPAPAQILARLVKQHPRVILTVRDLAALRERAQTDAVVKAQVEKVRAEADTILGQEPSRYEIPDGLRLLETSRRVRRRVLDLALTYLVSGDRRYLDRTWQELKAAAEFKDWNPRHFLDTAEMTNAFAIGYDWLFDAWTPEQRATLRTAMIDKGLNEALKIYRTNGWWAKATHNWNQVCNGGIGTGALAIADEAPELSGEILQAAIKSLPLAMREFGPDGAWSEGPGYWSYATSYNVMILAALQSALGTDFGLSQIAGFDQTGGFPIYLTGPLNLNFNYADSGDKTGAAPQLLWLARQFNQPDFERFQQAHTLKSSSALDIVYALPGLPRVDQNARSLPLDKYFKGAEVVSLRSAWNDPDALFIGFKAGDNKANHSHLDLGSFVFDALGERWAVDIGAEDYNVPAYFGNKRWTYYRTRAEGQNTLVLNPGADPDQDPRAAARITRFDSKPERAFAVADLSSAYAKEAQSVQRGIALLDRRQVLIQDEIKATNPAEIWWFMHTRAEILLSEDGSSATLTQGKVHVQARLLSPPNARFSVMDAAPLPESPKANNKKSNKGVRKLTVHLSGAADARIAVSLAPFKDGAPVLPQPQIKALADW